MHFYLLSSAKSHTFYRYIFFFWNNRKLLEAKFDGDKFSVSISALREQISLPAKLTNWDAHVISYFYSAILQHHFLYLFKVFISCRYPVVSFPDHIERICITSKHCTSSLCLHFKRFRMLLWNFVDTHKIVNKLCRKFCK